MPSRSISVFRLTAGRAAKKNALRFVAGAGEAVSPAMRQAERG